MTRPLPAQEPGGPAGRPGRSPLASRCVSLGSRRAFGARGRRGCRTSATSAGGAPAPRPQRWTPFGPRLACARAACPAASARAARSQGCTRPTRHRMASGPPLRGSCIDRCHSANAGEAIR
eukprot:scaffold14574_cov120-Isochrysis_galbana.AAC.10